MTELQDLRDIMVRLRDPDGGCPWDIQQDFRSIAPFTIEEAYEVADAIEREDMDDLCEELGDLLFQVVYHARMAEEQGAFSFDDVDVAIRDKLIRRHPHVFGDERITDAEAQTIAWETHKSRERIAKGDDTQSVLDQIPAGLPALIRAGKLGKKAASVGFDWPDISGVVDKIREEVMEFEEVIGGDASREEEELGDLLFAVVNLCRHRDVDPEAALRRSNRKFDSRFRRVEAALAEQGREARDSSIQDLEALWQQAKQEVGS